MVDAWKIILRENEVASRNGDLVLRGLVEATEKNHGLAFFRFLFGSIKLHGLGGVGVQELYF